MTMLRPSLSPLLIALAAIAGTLSLGSPASACSSETAARANTPRGCCSDRKMPASCGCCGADRAEPIGAVTRSVDKVISGPALLADAGRMASSCECRTGTPSAPGQRPARINSSERDDRTGVEVDLQAVVAVLSLRSLPAGTLARRIEAPSHTPLYLRTSRLLI